MSDLGSSIATAVLLVLIAVGIGYIAHDLDSPSAMAINRTGVCEGFDQANLLQVRVRYDDDSTWDWINIDPKTWKKLDRGTQVVVRKIYDGTSGVVIRTLVIPLKEVK